MTAYVVSWRLGRKGNFDDELTVRTALTTDSTIAPPRPPPLYQRLSFNERSMAALYTRKDDMGNTNTFKYFLVLQKTIRGWQGAREIRPGGGLKTENFVISSSLV